MTKRKIQKQMMKELREMPKQLTRHIKAKDFAMSFSDRVKLMVNPQTMEVHHG